MKRLLSAVLALTLAVTAGCSEPSEQTDKDQSGPVAGGTLTLSLFGDPGGVFNPILSEDPYDGQVIGLVFNGLLRLDEKLAFVCDLCRSYDVSEDNRTITFRLREDVKWHDGEPFTAEDVAFTFRAMLHPDYPGRRTGEFAALAGVQRMMDERDAVAHRVAAGEITRQEAREKNETAWRAWLEHAGKRAIRVIDPHTISFTTDQPYAPLLANLSVPIIPAHVFRMADWSRIEQHAANRTPIGTGPFKFAAYEPDQYVKLERNEAFHLGKPYIQTVVFRIVNPGVAVEQLRTGELDYTAVPPGDAERLQGEPHIRIEERPAAGYQYMGLNHDHPALGDRRVRQALMYGIDREALVRRLLKGHGTVINSHISPVMWAYEDAGLNPYPYDPETAEQLLADAGWSRRNGEGYRVNAGGEVLGFTLKYPAGNPVREASAPLIQADLKALGIKVELQRVEFAALSRQVFDERNMEAWLLGWDLGPDPDPGPVFLANNKWGRATGWRHQRNEELIRQGVRVLDIAERKPIYTEWVRILNEELPYIFLYAQNELEAVRTDRVKGLKPDARGVLWNIWELWIPKEKQRDRLGPKALAARSDA